MTRSLMRSRDKKEVMYRESRGNAELTRRYNQYRNCYKRAISKAKIIYFRKKIRESKGDGKKVWQTLKESMGVIKNKETIERLTIDGQTTDNPVEICDIFNNHSTSFGQKLLPELPVILGTT